VTSLAALAAVLVASGHAAATKQVLIKDIDFRPRAVTVHRGDRVRWRFADGDTPHNVSSRGRLRFKSSATKTTGTYLVRFAKKGTHAYVCTIHLGMAGKVIVR
jgi:plastocyanin